ncbi:MAG: hypothetical protein COB53_03975 [Elusimicrobia bacterium]|nr:MAG: hypothetical protein COB53_03975 [Elusimicrobiota bacterium]
MSLKAQEEKTVAARVENSIQEIQERLRRQKRDAATEEIRLKQDSKIQELENRLVQERETWVTTLKGQINKSESEDKDMESHFTMRIQEMERRWLEEKAHWNRLTITKDEELRKASEAFEKLNELTRDHEKLTDVHERLKEATEAGKGRLQELEGKMRGAMDREREYFQVKAEGDRARDQLRSLQEKYDRDTASARQAFKEREERILSDNERLQSDLGAVSKRIRTEYETEMRHIRSQHEAELESLKSEMGMELKKTKAQADVAGAALQRMRAVGSALEKQVATLRMQTSEANKLKDEVYRINERYKAEFLVLQRKWQEREVEIRHQVEGTTRQRFEAEKTKLKMRAQEEIQERIVKLQAQLRTEASAELAEREKNVRAEMERELAERSRRVQADLSEMRRKLESEIERKSSESERREADWKEKLLSKESDLAGAKSELDLLRGRVSQAEDYKLQAAREKTEIEKTLAAERERNRIAEKAASSAESRIAQAMQKAELAQGDRAGLEQVRSAAEGRSAELQRQIDSLTLQLQDGERGKEELRREKDALQSTVTQLEVEHARLKETWKRKIDLAQREGQSPASAEPAPLPDPPAETPSSGGQSLTDKMKGFFGGKKQDPPAPPQEGI